MEQFRSDNKININNELTAYIGLTADALIKQGYSAKEAKHILVASILEYILKTIAVDEDNRPDYYAIRPLLSSVKYIFDRELEIKQADAYIPEIQADMQKLKIISDYLDHRINSIVL